MESAQQDIVGAARCQCQGTEGVQSAAPLGLCDNLINALKLLANQQKDGDSPIQKHCNRLARKKQKRHHERATKILPSRQS